MIQTFTGLTASFVLFAIVAIAGALATRPLWKAYPVLGYVYAVGSVGVVGWALFVVFWINPTVGTALAVAVAVVSVVYLLWARAWRMLARTWPVVALSAGIMYAYVGFLFLWKSNEGNPFALAALRFSYRRVAYPFDNIIPYFLANRTGAGQSTQNLFDGWNGSDRPPLESGLILLGDHVLSPLALTGYTLPFALSVVTQLVWVPALFALLRTLGLRVRTATLGVVFAASSATMLLNTTYTWPKLLSTALVLGTLTLLVAAIRKKISVRHGLIAGAVLFTLGALSHGEAAFAIPAIAVLAVVGLMRSRQRVLTMLTAAVAAIATYLPWILYQTVFFPPGDRLLKWHLAGEEQPNSRSFLSALIHAYSTTPISTLVHNRIVNFARIFSPDVFSGWSFTESSIGARRFHEYYDSSAVLSLALFVLLAMVVVGVVGLLRRRRASVLARRIYRINLLMLLCVVVWGLVLFRSDGAVVHQGSHVWIVIFLATSYVWLENWNRWVAFAVLAAQGLLTAIFYTQFFGHTDLSWPGLAVLVGGIAVVAVAVVASGGRGASVAQPEATEPLTESRI